MVSAHAPSKSNFNSERFTDLHVVIKGGQKNILWSCKDSQKSSHIVLLYHESLKAFVDSWWNMKIALKIVLKQLIDYQTILVSINR